MHLRVGLKLQVEIQAMRNDLISACRLQRPGIGAAAEYADAKHVELAAGLHVQRAIADHGGVSGVTIKRLQRR